MTNQYHATPYDITAIGFYFSTYGEYCSKAASHRNRHGDPVEEYEIQFIDGNNYALFNALNINQSNLEKWFDEFLDLDDEDAVKVIFLSDYTCYPNADILEHLDDVTLFKGTASEYAEEYIEDSGLLESMPENLRYYFDHEAFSRDLILGGDITVVEIDNHDYVIIGG